jgi:hypothetical protein
MTDTVTVALIGGVIGPVIVLSLNYWLNHRKKTDMVAEALVVGEQVSTKLDTIREEYQADRVWLSQFHNGGHFYPTGKSIAKFSIFYETVSSNTTSIQLSLKNIPVALFSRSLNELVTNGVVKIPDFKDVTTSTFGLKYFAEEYGTKSQYLFAITNFEGRFIATLGVDYTHRKHKLNEEDILELERMATSLGGVLAKHLQV